MKQKVIVSLFVVFALAIFAIPVFAQAEAPPLPDFTNLGAVLLWLAGVGSVMAVNWIMANVLEKLAFWNGLPSAVKWSVPPVAAILIALGANWVLTQDAVVATVQPYWGLIVTIVLGYFASQVAHLQTKKAKGLG